MSKKVDVVLNRSGVRELLRSQAMMDICKRNANVIARKCGKGYEVSEHVGRNRVNVEVYARTYQAKADNLRNNTIMKAVGR